MGVFGNIREFVGSKPPLVVFFASIAIFALTLISVSLYFQNHKTQILNPDIKDWNSFYSTLSSLEICFPVKGSSKVSKLARTKRELPQEPKDFISLPFNMDNYNTSVANSTNITVSVLADVQVLKARRHLVATTLHTFLPAKYLGFKDKSSELEVTLELPSQFAKNLTTCVVFTGPPYLLPDSPIKPANCSIPPSKKRVEVTMGGGWLAGREDWCVDGMQGSLMIAPQDELNVYLTEGDITLIQLHILYTTVLLCVTLVLVLVYLMCGRRSCCCCISPTVVVAPDKVPLNP